MEYIRKNRTDGSEEVVNDDFVKDKLSTEQYVSLSRDGIPQATESYIYLPI